MPFHSPARKPQYIECHLKPVEGRRVKLNVPFVKGDLRVQEAFGMAMRRFRMDCGLSQEVLAGRAGLNCTYLGDVERGERNISIVNMQKLASALGIKLSDLVAEMERNLETRRSG